MCRQFISGAQAASYVNPKVNSSNNVATALNPAVRAVCVMCKGRDQAIEYDTWQSYLAPGSRISVKNRDRSPFCPGTPKFLAAFTACLASFSRGSPSPAGSYVAYVRDTACCHCTLQPSASSMALRCSRLGKGGFAEARPSRITLSAANTGPPTTAQPLRVVTKFRRGDQRWA